MGIATLHPSYTTLSKEGTIIERHCSVWVWQHSIFNFVAKDLAFKYNYLFINVLIKILVNKCAQW